MRKVSAVPLFSADDAWASAVVASVAGWKESFPLQPTRCIWTRTALLFPDSHISHSRAYDSIRAGAVRQGRVFVQSPSFVRRISGVVSSEFWLFAVGSVRRLDRGCVADVPFVRLVFQRKGTSERLVAELSLRRHWGARDQTSTALVRQAASLSHALTAACSLGQAGCDDLALVGLFEGLPGRFLRRVVSR